VALTELLGLVQQRKGAVEIAAVVIERSQQVEAIGQVTITAAFKSERVVRRGASDLMKPAHQANLILTVLDRLCDVAL
jgi:hypothetical protein